MRKTKYITIILSVIILILITKLVFYSRLTVRNEGIKYVIGVSQPNLNDPWRIYMNEEIKAEAAKHPDIKVLFYDAAEDDITQKRDIEKMLEQKVDLLIVAPNNSRFLAETISNVYNKGIPVILMEQAQKTEDYTMLIYSDNYKIGKLAGEHVAKVLGEKGGTVLEVQGEPDSPVTKERKLGFRDAIKDYPKIKIGYVVVGYGLRDKTEERVNEIYVKEPKVDVVFAHKDSMAVGAWRIAAYEKLNLKFIGIEGLPNKNGGIDAVDKGLLEATFIYPTGGRDAVVNALKILGGEIVPKKLELPATKVTRDNVKQYIK
jgi:galactofuranose transport system substrate-binding protein